MILPMSFWMRKKRRVYLDHAAATPLRKSVLRAMGPYLTTVFGNASAIHAEGAEARHAVEAARTDIARILGVKPDSVVFTGSGTESNNLAILGHLEQVRASGRSYSDMEVVTTAIEHPSILALIPVLTRLGVVVREAAVNEVGVLTRAGLKEVLTDKTVLVAFAYANSEIGTIQPVHQLVRFIREHEDACGTHIQIHLDAAQAPLYVPCTFQSLGVDSLALDAGKCGGPKGVGVLAVRDRHSLHPITHGGGQEGGLRPGTENVAGIVGAAVALKEAQATYGVRAASVSLVREAALSYLASVLPEAVVNGASGEARLPNNINFSLPGFDTEYAVVWLDTHGVSASTKSACAGAGGGISQVVSRSTNDEARARSTIRLTLGEETTQRDMEYAIDTVAAYCAKMRGLTK